VDRDFDVTPDEKVLLVHDALVGREFHPLLELLVGDKGLPWRFDAEAQGKVGVLNAAGVAFPAHDLADDASYA
jgi:hypothetical protein